MDGDAEEGQEGSAGHQEQIHPQDVPQGRFSYLRTQESQMIACSRSLRYTSFVQRVHQIHEVALVKIGSSWLVLLEGRCFYRVFGDVPQGELWLLYCICQGFSLGFGRILVTSTFFLHGGLARVLTLVEDSLGSEESTCAEIVGLEQMVELIIVDVLIGQFMA